MPENNNNKPVEHLTDHNFEEVLDRSYINVTNNALTSTERVEEDIDIGFMEASRNFWLKHEGGNQYQVYNEGIMSGTFNNRQATFRAIYETLIEAFKNIIRMECERDDKTAEDFAPYVTMLENSFDLLTSKMDDTLDHNVEGDLIMAYLHAVINSFVTTNIK